MSWVSFAEPEAQFVTQHLEGLLREPQRERKLCIVRWKRKSMMRAGERGNTSMPFEITVDVAIILSPVVSE